MITWLIDNLATLIVGVIVLAIVAAIVVKMIRDKKNHKGGCSCGCEGCPNSGICHSRSLDS